MKEKRAQEQQIAARTEQQTRNFIASRFNMTPDAAKGLIVKVLGDWALAKGSLENYLATTAHS